MKVDAVRDAALPAKLEADARALYLCMFVAHGRQPERLVVACVLVIPDPNERLLEKLDDGGEHLLAAKAGAVQVCGGSLADPRQHLRERNEAAVFHFVAQLPPSRMIPVLFASAGVAAGGLQVAERMRTDPDIAPGGRDDEGRNSLEDVSLGYATAVGPDIAFGTHSSDARYGRIVDIMQPCHIRRGDWIEGRCFSNGASHPPAGLFRLLTSDDKPKPRLGQCSRSVRRHDATGSKIVAAMPSLMD
jgi:hypothetical protein